MSGFIAAFTGNLRDECLKASGFLSIEEAKSKIEAWRIDCDFVDHPACLAK
jgi:hypothetical protein